jgi:hypothetical protein
MMHCISTYRVLAVLGLPIIGASGACCQEREPAEIVERFCRDDMRGEQLNPAGKSALNRLFLDARAPACNTFLVVRDYSLSKPFRIGDGTGFVIGFSGFGDLSADGMRFRRLPASLDIQGSFELVPTQIPNAESTPGHLGDRTEWRFKGQMPCPSISIDAAIDYVTAIVANAKDAAVKAGAERTQAALRRLRPTPAGVVQDRGAVGR